MHDDSPHSTDEQPPLRVLGYSDLENAYDDPERVGAIADLIARRRDERTLVVGGGDNTALGTLALLTDESRAQAVPFFEAVEPTADTFGNHDFDHGAAWAGEWASRVPATYCCANVSVPDGEVDSNSDGNLDSVPDATVVERDGHRVGIVGVAHPDTADICGTVDELAFGDPVATANDAFAELGAVDYRIVLAHCGAEDPTVAAGVDADVVLGGHLHSRRVELFDDTLLVRTAGGGTELVEVTLGSESAVEFHEIDPASFDPKPTPTAEADGGEHGHGHGSSDGRTVAESSDRNPAAASSDRNPAAASSDEPPAAASVAETYRERRAALGVDEVVAHVDDPLVRTERERFGGESRVGNFAADAMRASADAQLGLFPGGSVRTGDPITGAVTVDDVVSVCPFAGPVVELELDGAALRTVLAEAAYPHPGDRGWVQFHVSGGRVVWTDESELARATVGGDPLDPDRTYRVAAPEYVVTIESFGPLHRDSVVAEHDEQWQALVAHARDGGLDAECEGRIARVSPENVAGGSRN